MSTVYPSSEHLTAFHLRIRILNAYSTDIEPEADPFEERCERVLNNLRHWLLGAYGGEHLDDMLQEAHIRLWMEYQTRQTEMDAATDGLWFTLGRFGARSGHWRCVGMNHRKTNADGKSWHEPAIVCASDLVTDDEQDGDELLGCLAVDEYTSETREIEQADARLEVERILGSALAQLGPQRREQVKRLITGIMDDLPYVEIGREQHWSESTTREIVRQMRRVFYMVATGESYEASEGKQSPAAREAEVAQARRLKAQGYSLNQIGANLGKSKAWAQQATTPKRKVDPDKHAAAKAMKGSGATWKQVGERFGISENYAKQLFK
jgi:DNA-directed RNA polymerase specialized sigma24 family protein